MVKEGERSFGSVAEGLSVKWVLKKESPLKMDKEKGDHSGLIHSSYKKDVVALN